MIWTNEENIENLLYIYCIIYIKYFIFVIINFLIFLFNFILSKIYFYIIIREKDYFIIIKESYFQKDWKILKIVEIYNIWTIRFIKNYFFFNLFHCYNFRNMLQNNIFDHLDITYNILCQYILQSINSLIYFD